MKKINNWLKHYKTYWESQDIDGVLSLFSKDVEYGNFFKTHPNLNSLREEWESIKNQRDINLNYEVFSKEGNKYTVIWDLKYRNPENKVIHLKGTYLIKLNSNDKCIYFFHCGES